MPCPSLAEPGEVRLKCKAKRATPRPPADGRAAARAQCRGHFSSVHRQQGGQLTKELGEPFHSSKFKQVQVPYVCGSEKVSITERCINCYEQP